eukprot:TRINITY_DN4796_c0_g1_i1.p1 TRINITY_DN4796_c0_g1~~TRINITY_DN4796_c0_g1_i1.p1  ORF type:complete len:536 (+),score=114.85 TRINITY_DN4796_c0_g1_i1:103-1710(+)
MDLSSLPESQFVSPLMFEGYVEFLLNKAPIKTLDVPDSDEDVSFENIFTCSPTPDRSKTSSLGTGDVITLEPEIDAYVATNVFPTLPRELMHAKFLVKEDVPSIEVRIYTTALGYMRSGNPVSFICTTKRQKKIVKTVAHVFGRPFVEKGDIIHIVRGEIEPAHPTIRMRDMQRISRMTCGLRISASVKRKMIAECQSHVDKMIRLAISESRDCIYSSDIAELPPNCITAAMIQSAGSKMPDGMARYILGYSGDSTWKMFIAEVLHQIHPSCSFSPRMMQVMNDYVIHTCKMLVDYMKKNGMIVPGRMSQGDVHRAIDAVFVGELAKHAVSESWKAATVFREKPENSSHLPGKLQFPADLTPPLLRSLWPEMPIIEPDATVCIAASMEYMCAEALELSGNAMRDFKDASISPYHVALAIGMDDELRKTYHNVLIPYGFSCNLVERSASASYTPSSSLDDMANTTETFPPKTFNGDVVIPRLSFMYFVLERLEAINKDLAKEDPGHSDYSISDEAMDATQFLVERLVLQSAVDRFK